MDTPAINPYVGHPKNHRTTDKLWERFQGGELEDAALRDPYERTLVSDWKRCFALGVNPTLQEAPVLPQQEFDRVLRRKSFLLSAAQQALQGVSNLLEGVPGIVVFTDENGTVLQIIGEPGVRELAATSIQLMEGGCWGEATAGTNGIGTAVARRKPVHVYASEHFCEGWHAWTCAAAPVIDPFRNNLLGVVDFSTLRSEYRDSSLALSYSLATNITAELRVRLEVERIQLRQQFAAYSHQFPGDSLAVYDRMGLLVSHSSGLQEAPKEMLYFENSPPPGPVREVIPLFSPGSGESIGYLAFFATEGKLARASRPFDSQPDQDVATYGTFVTADPDLKQVMGRLRKISATDLGVLLIGETGTGKELIANYVHHESGRRSGPFVAVNCGAISKELFESRFFGYEKGGFTGADPKGRKGLLECADNGTLFLDEIGELPLEMQAGLLRVLETGRFRPIGSDREKTTNCRLIAATNRPLLEAVDAGIFRSDLYYRLSVAQVSITPLRERREDIGVLVRHLTRQFCTQNALTEPRFTEDALQALFRHDWPGNCRELKNVLEAAAVCTEGMVTADDLPTELRAPARQGDEPERPDPSPPGEPFSSGVGATPSDQNLRLRDQERRLIVSALQKYKKISLAARKLGISRSTLYRRLEQFGIDPKDRSTYS